MRVCVCLELFYSSCDPNRFIFGSRVQKSIEVEWHNVKQINNNIINNTNNYFFTISK